MTDAPPAVKAPSVELTGHQYEIQFQNFDGPLDLLLHLIRTEEFDIFDIPISGLTARYLESLEEMRRKQIEPASDFLLMAATLIQIKSRMLLPRPTLDDIELEGEDPREALMLQLLEYQRFKEVASELRDRDQIGRDVFLRPTGLDRPPTDIEDEDLAAQSIFRLGEAFRSLLSRGHFEAPHDIHVERISIGERIAQVSDLLAQNQQLTFASLCEGFRYREEIITTFLALLEMARLKLISVTQGDRLGEVYVASCVEGIRERGEAAAGMISDE